jgi:hypothetical protein
MPEVYYLSCRKCGANSCETGWYDALFRDGKEIPLRHPIESLELEKFHLTRETAARSGVLHRFKAFGCRKCGSVSYVKFLALPTALTGLFLVIIAASLAAFAVLVSNSIWWCALLAAIILVPAIKMDIFVSRSKAQHKHGFVVHKSCVNCGSSDTAKIGDVLISDKLPLLCKSCGERQNFLDHTAVS